MKKSLWTLLLIGILFLAACTQGEPTSNVQQVEVSPCKLTPLAEGCFIPSDDLDFISVTPEEYLVTEDFDDERVNSTPRNWLLYRDQEYAVEGVITRISEMDGNRFVRMYSDGLRAPQFPQSAPTPTFIFTTKFNLDIDRKGVAYASVMIPTTEKIESVLEAANSTFADKNSNTVTVGVATGAVNAISVNITSDLRVQVRVGGPFFYFSGSSDGVETFSTDITISKDVWYTFKYEWDASLNVVSAYMIQNDQPVLLYTGPFHISNRFNAESNGVILVPNVVRVTMPRRSSGWAFLDNVIVERKGE